MHLRFLKTLLGPPPEDKDQARANGGRREKPEPMGKGGARINGEVVEGLEPMGGVKA